MSLRPPAPASEPRSAGRITAEKVATAFPDLVALADVRSLKVVWANKQIRDVLGFTTEEVLALGSDVLEQIVHPDDLTLALSYVERIATLGDGEVAEQQLRLRRKDGSIRRFSLRNTVFERAADGSVAITLGVVQDVTDHKDLQARLMIADRMASMGTLAAGVAHEINNPLAYVTANLEASLALLAHDEASPDATPETRAKLRGLLEESLQGAARVRDIVRDLRTFSRPEPESSEPLDLRRALDSTVQMAWNEVRHRAQLSKDYGPVPLVDAPRGRVGQLLLNLVVNAAQSIPEGDAQGHQIRIVTATHADGRAIVEVHDSGVGIAPDDLPHLFDPFFTTRAPGGGTGLGLSICHGIVRSLGGDIEVQSAPGRGSTFRVLLPASVAARPPPARPASVPPPRAVRRGRVLIVDDEPRFAQSLAHLLADEHDVVAVTRARDGLARLLGAESFDAVLCDLMMPEMTGIELRAALEARRPELLERLLFVTGGAFTPRASEFVRAHSAQVLEKPIDHDALRRRLRRLVSP